MWRDLGNLLYPFLIAVLVLPVRAGEGSFEPARPVEGQQQGSFRRRGAAALAARFLLFMPQGFARDQGKRWPLIFFLHGSGEAGTDLAKLKKYGPPKLVKTRPKLPFIVVSPQLPKDEPWPNDVLDALLDEILARLPADRDRVYLTGLSLGGYGAWSWAADSPRHFAAIAPVSGGGNAEQICRLKDLPVWAFHGEKDLVVPLSEERALVQAVNACGGQAKLTVYPGADHNVWARVYDAPALYDWFLKNRRAPAPAR